MVAPDAALFARLTSEAALLELASAETESLHLDFKAFPNARPLEKDKEFLKLLAKAVSGFANANGGVLVIGIEDSGRTADPIQGLAGFAATLQEQLSRLVAFPVEGIEARAILAASAADAGFLVLRVPASDLAPHRSQKDQKYYRRTGESFVPMEHYEVPDVFGRRHQPVLVPAGRVTVVHHRVSQTLRLLISLKNRGRAVARYPMLRISSMGAPLAMHDLGPSNRGFPLPMRLGPAGHFQGGADDVIHAGDGLAVCLLHGTHEGTLPEASDATLLSAQVDVAAEGMAVRRYELSASATAVQRAAEDAWDMEGAGEDAHVRRIEPR